MSQGFDIITGQPRRKYMSDSRPVLENRSKSQNPFPQNYTGFNPITNNNPTYSLSQFQKSGLPKLGVAKDHKKDFYEGTFNQHSMSEQGLQSMNKTVLQDHNRRMVNAVSTPYNIINHTNTAASIYDKQLINTSKIAYKQDAISKIYDLGRLYAPNFNEQYQEKYKSSEKAFYRGKGSCAEILQIGKSYGPRAKLFRKYK